MGTKSKITASGTRSTKVKTLIFAAVGIFNTLFDIVVYLFVLNLTNSIILANVIATSLALIGSFILNSKLTFQTKKWTAKRFMAFVVVTVIGLWFLQTACIYAISHFLNQIPSSDISFLGSFKKLFKQLAPKLLATAVTLVWNYLWYSKVIFKPEEKDEAKRLAYTDL